MRSNDLKKCFDVLLVLFFLVGVFIFFKRNVIKPDTDDVTNYPITEIQLSFDTSISIERANSIMPITYSGYIRNIGTKDLYIGKLETSCRCTDLIIKKLIVDPMDSSQISFSINPIEKGKDVINIYFDANTKQKRHRIRVQYEVIK